jgi:hypothetical protein
MSIMAVVTSCSMLCGECGKQPHPGADCSAAAVGAHLSCDGCRCREPRTGAQNSVLPTLIQAVVSLPHASCALPHASCDLCRQP